MADYGTAVRDNISLLALPGTAVSIPMTTYICVNDSWCLGACAYTYVLSLYMSIEVPYVDRFWVEHLHDVLASA